MAHIRCKYCTWQCAMDDQRIAKCMEPEYGGVCDDYRAHWNSEDEIIYLSPVCVYAIPTDHEFEGDYKKWEMDADELHVAKHHINTDNIEYLEIDGDVRINGWRAEQ